MAAAAASTATCQGCGRATTTQLCCPVCTKYNRTNYFCSQHCFKTNYGAHKELHALMEQQERLKAQGASKEDEDPNSMGTRLLYDALGQPNPNHKPPGAPHVRGPAHADLKPAAAASERESAVWRRARKDGARKNHPPTTQPRPGDNLMQDIPLDDGSAKLSLPAPPASVSLASWLQGRGTVAVWLLFALLFALVMLRVPGRAQSDAMHSSLASELAMSVNPALPQSSSSLADRDLQAITKRLDSLVRELELARVQLDRHDELLEFIGRETGLAEKMAEEARAGRPPLDAPDAGAGDGDAKLNPRLVGRKKDVDAMQSGVELALGQDPVIDLLVRDGVADPA